MDTGTLVLIELVLIFGLVLAFGLREFWSVRRDSRRAQEAERSTTPDRDY